ncbi:hypothetical protein BK126_04535 [Paenibacillus sp. FSL H7-0326]|uniref:hypothetical protein n=1 Tax=Paenibacillus sp. FSL H7-0326 TaxID=1921144 RepID=UPI00096BDDA3|nr:hypothetical protein [Paenibacillus sp. FSL H7-0326]OMC71370.1 hypothetical protein BK126_04535 [Paenibacillus sp. FSL H7-0326]
MSRDWHKDMESVESFKRTQALLNGIQPTWHGEFSKPEPDVLILDYWLQQYAAEKERADKAEAEAEKWRREAFRKYPTPEAYDAACTALHKHRERADRYRDLADRLEAELAELKASKGKE